SSWLYVLSHTFSFMLRREHISTLFPYTTLFRSSPFNKLATHERTHLASPFGSNNCSIPMSILVQQKENNIVAPLLTLLYALHWDGAVITTRSEEHTSELQSRFDLVCRLLLEKKKT